jgi:putative oxidoreductase
MFEKVQSVLRLGLKLCGALSFLAPLATRAVLGMAFMQTGMGKLQNFENTVTFFTELGIPFPEANAAFVATLEFAGGIAIIAGLATRLMAAGLASTMVVALLTADQADFLASWTAGDKGPLDVVPFAYLLFLSWLVLLGPGAVSVDWALSRWLGLRPGTERKLPENGLASGMRGEVVDNWH